MNFNKKPSQCRYSVVCKLILFLAITLFFISGLRAQVVVDTFNLPSGYTNFQLRARNVLKADPSNNIWVGFQKIGAGKFNGLNWTLYDTTNGLPSMNVLSFAFTGNVKWIGTDHGLAKLDGNSWTIYDSLNSGLTTNYILSLFTDSNKLWIGTKAGAFKFDGINWTHYSTFNSGLISDTVNCFTRSGNDTIWMGTNTGLAKFFNGVWSFYFNTLNGVETEPISKIVADGTGNVWIDTYLSSYNYNRVLYQDSIRRISGFFSYCYPTGEAEMGTLLGLSHGNIVFSYNHVVEINQDITEMWEAPVGVSFYNAFADLDSFGKVWIISYPSLRLLSIDYRSSLQLVAPAANCNTLDINMVQARMSNNGSMFWDLIGNAQYEVPKGSGVNSIFADALWIGGMDASNNLHLSAQTYRQSGNDFWPGPLDTINATIDSSTVQQYDKIWKIDLITVEEFIRQFYYGNVSNGTYNIPDVILRWPAHGFGNTSHQLAPFVDRNGDGIYNPYDGDYPEIKGDQMLWFVFNDNYSSHGETGGMPMGLEIQCTAYAYNCPLVDDSESVINYTTFYHYKIFNRSDTSYTQVYMGRFTDTDLGNYLDDYIGCDTTLNTAYTYNGDNYDDRIIGYGENPPIQNLLYLSDTMTHFTYYNNNADTISGNPENPVDYNNYMQSNWKNGNHITYGGNGHGGGPGATNIPANFMFPGNPYDNVISNWTEITAGNIPDDRRFVTSTGPFDFPAHTEKDFDFAYVWTRDSNHPNGLATSWTKNVHDVLKIKEWYVSNSFPCNNTTIGIYGLRNNPASLIVYPNPARQTLTVFIHGKENSIFNMIIMEATGRKVSGGIIFANRNNNINLDGILPGLYFIKVNDNEIFAVKKFVKQ